MTAAAGSGRREAVWRNRPFWSRVAAMLIIALLVDGVHLYLRWHSLQQERGTQAKIFTRSVAEIIDLKPKTEPEIRALLETIVRGSIYYAQWALGGQIRVELRSPEAASLNLPPLETGSRRPHLELRTLADGLPILDVTEPLPYSDGYVRVGFSMASVVWTAIQETLLALGISVAGVFGLGLLVTGTFLLKSRAALRDSAESSLRDGQTPTQPQGSTLSVSGLRIDDARKAVFSHNGHALPLSPKEYSLLRLLASEPGRVFSAEEIRRELWSNGHGMTRKDVTHYVYLLRKRLQAQDISPQIIENVRGHGYKLSL